MPVDHHPTGTEAFILGPKGEPETVDPGSRPVYGPAKNGAEYNYRRLLGALRRLNVCATGDTLKQSGVLFWGANLLMLIAFAREEEPDAKKMRKELCKIAPEAPEADIGAAIAHALKSHVIGPDARRIGRDIDLRFNRWFAGRYPNSILPRNRTDEQIAESFRENENKRKRDRRKAGGSRPQHRSNSKLAKRLGKDRGTIARWIADGIIDPATGALTGKPLPKPGRKPGRNMPQKRPAICKDNALLPIEESQSMPADETAAFNPAPSGAPAFTADELTHMAAAVEIGLEAGDAVPMPDRKAVLARLYMIAAKAFAPRPANHPKKDENPMISDGRASSADAYRPLTVPGDMPPDEPNVIVPAIPQDDDTPPVAEAIEARIPDGPGRIDSADPDAADDPEYAAWLAEEAAMRGAGLPAGPIAGRAALGQDGQTASRPGDGASQAGGASQPRSFPSSIRKRSSSQVDASVGPQDRPRGVIYSGLGRGAS